MAAPMQRSPAGAATEEPEISGRIVAELRLLMIADGVWPQVRERLAARDPGSLRWLDATSGDPWLDLPSYLVLVESAAETLGLPRLRALGRKRMAEASRSGIFAAIVRGWLRSFERDPAQVLRVAPHLWRAGMRGGGSMRVVSASSGALLARLMPGRAASLLAGSAAWRALLEGFCTGLLDLCGAPGQATIGASTEAPGAVDILFSWRPEAAAS